MFLRRIASLTLVFFSSASVVLCGDLELGVNYKGSTSHSKSKRGDKGYEDSVEITLRSDQKLAVSVTADDGKQAIGVALVDKNGDLIHSSWKPVKGPAINGNTMRSSFASGTSKHSGPTATLTLDKVPSAGTYNLVVLSGKQCDYTVLAIDPLKKDEPKARDVDAIRKELAAAEKRVEELKRELKEKQDAKVGK